MGRRWRRRRPGRRRPGFAGLVSHFRFPVLRLSADLPARPVPSFLEVAQVRRLEAAARWRAAQDAEWAARTAMAEARAAEAAELWNQPAPFGPTLIAGVRSGFIIALAVVALGVGVSEP